MAFILLKSDPMPISKYLEGRGLKRVSTDGCRRQIFGT